MTWQLRIHGLVQGVGFRPFVYHAARLQNRVGVVSNGAEGVRIKFNGTAAEAADFEQFILKNAPALAHISHHTLVPDTPAHFDDFSIDPTAPSGTPTLMLTPDVAVCADCCADLNQPDNRRYQYAFTTCAVCGPRFSILKAVPYDRVATTMQDFPCCTTCQQEYLHPENRRFYAQTISCPQCGIQLSWHNLQHGSTESGDEATLLQKTVDAWRAGAIVAIKGMGGYLLTCDAANAAAIQLLRARKHRPVKPFALLYPSLHLLQQDATVSPAAAAQLSSPEAPIVVLPLLPQPASGMDQQGIAPRLSTVGAMLPNTPLLTLLMQSYGKPVVATSANRSHAPLVYKNEEALTELAGIADFVLSNNRDIVMPQDDGVVVFWPRKHNEKAARVVIRRSRGMAPAMPDLPFAIPAENSVLALGATQKATFTLSHQGTLHVSQYLGDLSDFDVQQRYMHCLNHFCTVLQARPAVVLTDLHPGYFTSQLDADLPLPKDTTRFQVQHHQAHFAAVLAENNLFASQSAPVLGVVWDGTGYGLDGQIWGGECFTYTRSRPEAGMARVAHFDTFPMILGDKMPKEPRISALAACHQVAGAAALLRPKFTEQAWQTYQTLLQHPVNLTTSSVGRLFDAVACLLGLADVVSYEGEAALLLEDLARQYYRQNGLPTEVGYVVAFVSEATAPRRIDTTGLMQQITQDIQAGVAPGLIALRWHQALVTSIQLVAQNTGIQHLAFSGGVFQNTLLLELLDAAMGASFKLYFHRELSPNDENISFGQWAYHTFVRPHLPQATGMLPHQTPAFSTI
jgi:hydrogenase maturation protein HypF